MASRGRTSLGERSARSGRGKSGKLITPLYKRLPHGPHRLGRNEVIQHQRTRIHGAMIEAVWQDGYEGTSVKQVIGLAGVSRRSFYEQFANKEECFLATFDMLAERGVKRLRMAYLSAGGGIQERLSATFAALADAASNDRKAAGLVVVESQMAGPPGLLRLRRATATCEQLLSQGFVESPETQPLAAPIVRGIAGGLHGALSTNLREGRPSADELAGEMLQWTLLFQTDAAERMTERIATRVARLLREAPSAGGERHAQTADTRERLLQNVLRLAVVDDYRELTAPQIAEESGISIDAFFDVFADKEECFLAALNMLGDEMLVVAADPSLVSADWPFAVRAVLGKLTRFLAGHPVYAQTIAQEAFAAGSDAVECDLELAHSIATLLTEGAPNEPLCPLALEGIAGALWHTVRWHVTSSRIQLLPAVSDHLAYVVLAPFIGADAAAEVISDDRPLPL